MCHGPWAWSIRTRNKFQTPKYALLLPHASYKYNRTWLCSTFFVSVPYHTLSEVKSERGCKLWIKGLYRGTNCLSEVPSCLIRKHQWQSNARIHWICPEVGTFIYCEIWQLNLIATWHNELFCCCGRELKTSMKSVQLVVCVCGRSGWCGLDCECILKYIFPRLF